MRSNRPDLLNLLLILLIVLVLFEAKKLPELARGLGQGMNEFKKAREDFDRELHRSGTQPPRSGRAAEGNRAAERCAGDIETSRPTGGMGVKA